MLITDLHENDYDKVKKTGNQLSLLELLTEKKGTEEIHTNPSFPQ